MPIEQLPIFSYFNKQRFTQFGSGDLANWYGIQVEDSKAGQALYPAMGRRHITFLGQNKLIFNSEPRQIFKSINFLYVIDGTSVIQVDRFYNEVFLGSVALGSNVWFDFLPVNNIVYCMLTDGVNIFVITETPSMPTTMVTITDPLRPTKPQYVAAFGGLFVVSQAGTPNFYLSAPNLGGVPVNPATAFQYGVVPNQFAQMGTASGVIGQLGALHNQLYIFTDFTTDIWANIQSTYTVGQTTRTFPFKRNSSYNWDYGIQDPFSLSIDFGMLAFLGKNRQGLVSFFASSGQQPENISSQAVNVLLENSTSDADDDTLSPFITGPTNAFLYQYENTIFYRASAGKYLDSGELDITDTANSIEYNFSTKKWNRDIELNGERSRVEKHEYFNNKHLVTVQGDPAIYEIAGNVYRNELRTPGTMPQDVNAFSKYPMRYELVTQQIFEPDYSEFLTDYVEIDFVFGNKTFFRSNAPFDNTVFIIAEDADINGNPIYLITEDSTPANPIFIIIERGNTPTFDDNHYNSLFKPHIELYYSDDGGITYQSADLREFSPLGEYKWRMRWYQLGASRNRCYMLVAVSSAPIVVLGGVQNKRRSSGGGN